MSTTATEDAVDDAYVGRAFAFITDAAERLTDGYDELRVFKTKRSGDVVELTNATTSNPAKKRPPLVADKCNYNVLDDKAKVGELYHFEVHDQAEVLPPIVLEAVEAVDTSYESVLTISELKKIYLFGIDLTDDDGNPYPDILFVHYIRTGISQVEHELDMPILPTKFVENYDHRLKDYARYAFIQLANYPLISVEKVILEYPSGDDIIDFPLEWIRPKHFAGQIELLPSKGTFSQLLISAGGGFLPLVLGGADYIPDLIQVTYTAGFLPMTSGFGMQSITGPQRLTAAIKEVIGKKAAFGPLNTAGDLIVGAGIANRSLSIDGLSQTIGTTSSATNAGYGARLIQYEKELKKAIPDLRKYYKGAKLAVA